MIDYDMQLARGADDGSFNLAIGEPYFLQDALKVWGVFPTAQTKSHTYPPPAGDPALVEALQARYPGKYIVVANGAKQALFAAVHALNMAGEHYYFHTPKPYWPSFETIADQSGLYFSPSPPGDRSPTTIRLLTYPNNPDGINSPLEGNYDIWDAAYAHPVYGYSPADVPNHRIKIESAAKMFGLSGFRVGWLITDDKQLASYAARYVEITTSGVSVPAQRYVAYVLKWDAEGRFAEEYNQARNALLANGSCFNAYLGGFVDEVRGVPHNGTGMFAWFHVKDEYQEQFSEALTMFGVKLISGEACGGGPGWYRMSMGCKPTTTNDALRTLSTGVLALA